MSQLSRKSSLLEDLKVISATVHARYLMNAGREQSFECFQPSELLIKQSCCHRHLEEL